MKATKETMVAYFNDPDLKTAFVQEIKKHQQADMIVQGVYETEEDGKWRGCAVGCSIHSLNAVKNKTYQTNDHSAYEKALGMPEWLARLEDTIFEGLPKDKAMEWPLRFAQAVPVGANLEPVKWQSCAYILGRNIERVLTLKISDDLKEQVVSAIRGVLTLHEQAIKTGKWDESAAWSAAESAAWSAWSAAESAAWSAWSAWSAAWSARSAAESAAWSAAWSARSAAESAEYEDYADKLIALLKKA